MAIKLKPGCSKTGFTLVELLIVIAIIAVLFLIAFLVYQKYSKKMRDTHRKAELETIRNTLQDYYADCGHFPVVLAFGGVLRGDGSNCPFDRIYAEQLPQEDMGGLSYSYTYADAHHYILAASLEEEIDPTVYNYCLTESLEEGNASSCFLAIAFASVSPPPSPPSEPPPPFFVPPNTPTPSPAGESLPVSTPTSTSVPTSTPTPRPTSTPTPTPTSIPSTPTPTPCPNPWCSSDPCVYYSCGTVQNSQCIDTGVRAYYCSGSCSVDANDSGCVCACHGNTQAGTSCVAYHQRETYYYNCDCSTYTVGPYYDETCTSSTCRDCDTNGNGCIDQTDMDDFKTCFGQGMPGGMPPITDHCNHWDVTRDGLIDIVDYSWCRKCACK